MINNAHIKRGDITKDTVILKGDPEKSRLLEEAVHISKEGKQHWIASDQFCDIIGRPYGYNLLRSSPRVVEGKFAEDLVNFIIS